MADPQSTQQRLPAAPFSERLHWFGRRYNVIETQYFSPGSKKVFLGGLQRRVCRYCGKGADKISFRNESHALPELMGNKWLIDLLECDACNAHFAKLDDHLGKWTHAWRTMGRHDGKKGIPAYKTKDGSMAVKPHSAELLELDISPGDPRLIHSEENKTFKLVFQRASYIQVAVYKALLKMAIAVLPEPLAQRCGHLKDWLLESWHTQGDLPALYMRIFHEILPGPMPNDGIGYVLLQRRPDMDARCPFLIFTVTMGNHCFQITLPMPEEDRIILGTTRMNTPTWPHPGSALALKSGFGVPTTMIHDMSSVTPLEGDQVELRLRYEATAN